jgi:hypothetical protein
MFWGGSGIARKVLPAMGNEHSGTQLLSSDEKQPKDCAFQSDWLYTGGSFDNRDRIAVHLL